MKKINIAYYIVTGILTLAIVPGAITNVASAPEWIEVFHGIGMPEYLIPFLGVAKILGIIAIWIPGYPRIKEWAYAGIFYDLLGATYGGFVSAGMQAWPMLMFMAIIIAAYIIYQKRLNAMATMAA